MCRRSLTCVVGAGRLTRNWLTTFILGAKVPLPGAQPIEANRALFFEADGAPRSVQGLLAKLDLAPGSSPAPTPPQAGGFPAQLDLAMRDPAELARGIGFDLWSLALRAYRARE